MHLLVCFVLSKFYFKVAFEIFAASKRFENCFCFSLVMHSKKQFILGPVNLCTMLLCKNMPFLLNFVPCIFNFCHKNKPLASLFTSKRSYSFIGSLGKCQRYKGHACNLLIKNDKSNSFLGIFRQFPTNRNHRQYKIDNRAL